MPRNAQTTGYGVTGDPSYPYHPEFGPDTYYPAPPTDAELRARYREAERGFQALHAFFAARAMTGDQSAMPAWEEVCKTIWTHGYPGLSCGRNVAYQESSFNRKAS